MRTDATLIKDMLKKVRGLEVCCTGITKLFSVIMALVFSSSFLMAQSNFDGNEPLIIVKKATYPGQGVVPQEVEDFLAEYGTQLSNSPLGTTEPGEAPTIENCPDDRTVECFLDVGHTAEELEYTINCGPNGIIIIYEPPGILDTGSCPGTEYVVTYDVWDQCGNNVTCDQIFTIDNPAPEITFCPEGGEIASEDEAVADIDALEFTFSCPEDPLCSDIDVSVELEESYDPCIGEIFTFTYTITDACDRSDMCEQVFIIPPADLEVVCDDDEVVECASDIDPSEDDIEIIGLIDDVDYEVSISDPMLVSGEDGCSGAVYEVTYIVTDDCDREASCTRSYTLENAGPTIEAPADVIIECASEAAADIDGVVVSYSCDLMGEVSAEGPILIEGDGFCDGSIWKFVYTVTDECGRTSSDEQQVFIENDGPTIVAPDDVTIECAADAAADEDGVEVTTSCDLGFEVSSEGPVLVEGDGFCPGSVWEFIYTVTDDCGRMAMDTQKVFIENDGPSIEVPANATVECTEDTSPASLGMAEVSDPCEDVEAVYEDVIVQESCPQIIERNWSVTNSCGLSAEGVQVITVEDNTPPVLIMPDVVEGDVTCSDIDPAVAEAFANGELSEEEEAEFLANASSYFVELGLIPVGAEDECSPASFGEVEVNVEVIDDCPVLVQLECIFQAMDECGNMSETASTFINIVDNTAPEIMCPMNAEVSCEDGTSPDVTGMATATDDCGGEVSIDYMDEIVDDGCPTIILRTFTATDECGNSSSCMQEITVTFDDPTIVAPADVIIECASEAAPDIEGAEFTTSCDLEGEVTAEGPILIEGDGFCDGSVWEFVYTVTDDCGNMAMDTQKVFIENEGPTLVAPDDVTIECASEAAPDIDGVETSFSCDFGGEVMAEGPILIEGDGFCDGSVWEFVYSVEDDCGRMASDTQKVFIENEGPTLVAPDDVTIECASEAAPDIDGVEVSFSCDFGGEVMAEGPILIEGDGFCDGSVWEFVYSVEDDCGRMASDTQKVFIENEGPTLVAPDDVTIECASEAAPDIDGVEVSFSCDFGGEVMAEGPILIEGDGFCDGSVWEFVYSVEDDCGRVASDTQKVFIENEGPTLVAPDDVTIECASEAAPNIDGVEVSFSCDFTGEVTAEGPILIEGDGFCDGSVWQFIYSVEDECGRVASDVQQVFIENEGPSIVAPDDVIIECASEAAPDIEGAVVSAACELGTEVTAEGPVLIEGDGFCDGSVWEFIYTVTDDCGRMDMDTQTVFIENEGPSIEAPADVEVICIDDFVPNADDAMVMAACELETTVEVSEPVLISGQGSCNLTQYEVTYTVEDACGRTDSDTQIVTCVNDGLTVFEEPDDMTVECYDDIMPDPWGIEYFSPCSSDVFIQVSPPTQLCCDEDCPGAEYVVIYTVTNDCGDEEVIEQIFTIDNEGPVIISCGESMTVESPEDIMVSPDDVIYETACGTECEVTVVGEPEIVEEECATLYIYTYEVLDDCGRLATCERIFTVPSDDPSCTDDNDCADFTTWYTDISGGSSTLYQVDFSGSTATLTYEFEVDFGAHIAFDAINNVVYLVDSDGDEILAYNPDTDTELFSLTLGGSINQLFAVVYNPADQLIYVGDANDDEIYTIDPDGTGDPVFFANAPIAGGDLALQDGQLYLVNRDNSNLYTVAPDPDGISDGDSDATLVGNTGSPEISGMAPANNSTELILSNANTMNFTKVSASDASQVVVYMAMLDGEPFELADGGDMASGCANTFGTPPCNYRLYYTHEPEGGQYDLLQVVLTPLGEATYTTLLENIGQAHIALDPSGDFIYIVGNNLRVYDVDAGMIIATLPIAEATGAPLSGFPSAVCGEDGTLYAGNSGENQVYTIDVGTGVATPFGPSVNVNGGDLIFVDGDLWSINRGSNTFTKVLTGEEFSVEVDEINGAAVLENGNVLLADGNGESLLKEVDLSTLEIVATYDIDLPLFNGDLAGRCTGDNTVEDDQESSTVYGGPVLSLPSEVYPNPATDNAVIVFEPVENVRTQVDLFDLSGRPMSSLFNAEVKAGLEYRVNVNTRTFEDGIYIYRVTNGSHQVTKKLIISK